MRTPQRQTHVVITNVGTAAATVAVKASGASGKRDRRGAQGRGRPQASSGVTLGGQTISPSTGQLSGRLVTTTVAPQKDAYEVTVPAASAEIVTFKG